MDNPTKNQLRETMRSPFPLFSNPLDLAHHFWEKILTDGDIVIDATCGNGKDSLILAGFLQKRRNTHLYCVDIQESAIQNTKKNLSEKAFSFLSSIDFLLMSHADLEEQLLSKTKLIVYNLGYLPGSDKSITTLTSSTLSSLRKAIRHMPLGGMISITCYPGHLEGKKEEEQLLSFVQSLDPMVWGITYCTWPNRSASPSFLCIQKSCRSTS